VRLLAALVLPPLLAVGFAYTAERVVGGPPAPQVRAEGLVWGKRTFATRADFARWLQAHGRSYDVWAARHPLPKVASSRDDRSSAHRLPSASSRVAFLGVTVAAVAAIALVILRRRRSRRLRRGLPVSRALPWLGASYARAHSATLTTWHDHPDLVWYLAGVALVAGAALVVASWG
jgi:hypothetical protein